MARLLIHVEGQTEENFVNALLRDHLISAGYHSVAARILGNARLRHRRGGICSWATAKKEIVNHLSQDRSCIATTLVDFYGLPDWPGRTTARLLTTAEAKAERIQRALGEDMSDHFDRNRFVPFVVMHEFEGLLFSDCSALSRGIFQPTLADTYQSIRNQFATPEDINDSPETAPSKRLLALVPGYQKPLFGVLATLEIGLDRIRTECPNFHRWIDRLERLASSAIPQRQ